MTRDERLSGTQGLLVNGEQRNARRGGTFETLDPATGEVLATVALATGEDVDDAVAAARAAFDRGPWPRMRASERGRILHSISARLRSESDRLAEIESRDVGKPLREARADVEAAARYFEFYGGYADKIGGTTIPVADHLIDFTLREPIGVSGQIIPFNYPMQNTARGAAPALAAGCTVVLKPSPECPLGSLALAQIASECGVPAGALNVVPGRDDAGARLASHSDIDQLTFTGSVPTGISVACAAAQNVVPTTLELGGKSATIVFNDADFERALAGVMGSAFSNAGQTCAAGTRLLVQKGTEGDRFLELLTERTQKLSIGAGIDDPDLGPLVSSAQRDRVEAMLSRAKIDGARMLVGGGRPSAPTLQGGFFIEPTICVVEDNSVQIAREEIFGPVLTAIRFEDEDEAVAIANDSPYGLSSYVWTANLDAALTLSKGIRAGQVNINIYDVGTGVELPFGGYKKSGWGREKGILGIESYLQTKNVCIGIRI